MSVLSDFEEFFASCDAEGVRYLVIGGYAVAHHGVPRFTKDLDVLVDPSPDNAQRVVRALERFGMSSLRLAPADFERVDVVIQIGFPPNRIDLLTSATGIDFGSAWKRRVRGPFGGVTVSYLSLRDLLANKRATARPQDQVDVSLLQKLGKRRTPRRRK